jgi:hypothetical protein
MKLLLIRHGEPDYEHDTLTEKGRREAEYLADMLAGQGFQQAANAIAQAAESGDGQGTAGSMTPFAAIGTGMFELGWQVKPDASPLTLDLGLTAWAGKQRGLTGQLGMNWKF